MVAIPEGALVDRDFYFSEDDADHATAFFEVYLRHSKGQFAGQPFTLEPWQRKIIRDVFGWKRISNGTRRYRTVYIEVPRKNGKSTLAAGVALYLTTADGEPGAEVYGAALDKEQAMIVFREASNMVKQCPELRELCDVQTRAIIVPETSSVYRVLSADSDNKHGLNTHGIVFDELHAQGDRDLFDVLQTSTGARRQPLTFIITTAGSDKNSVCWEQHDYAVKVRDGVVDDPTFYACIFAAGEGDDWKDPATWKKANPNYGVSLDPDFLAQQVKEAQEKPAYENTVKRLHLNIWTEQDTRWLPLEVWDDNPADVAIEEQCEGRACYIGLDLSSTRDITAAVRVFPRDDGTFDVLPRFYVPRDTAPVRQRRDRVPYDDWIRAGLIIGTPGNVIDYEFIKADLLEDARRFNLRAIAYDPWSATQIALQLAQDGAPVVEVRQGFASMGEPTKTLEKLVMARKIRHGNNKVLRWMLANAAIDTDPAGNIKPSKKRAREKIDGVVALIMALARATLPDDGGTSVYDSRGMIEL